MLQRIKIAPWYVWVVGGFVTYFLFVSYRHGGDLFK